MPGLVTCSRGASPALITYMADLLAKPSPATLAAPVTVIVIVTVTITVTVTTCCCPAPAHAEQSRLVCCRQTGSNAPLRAVCTPSTSAAAVGAGLRAGLFGGRLGESDSPLSATCCCAGCTLSELSQACCRHSARQGTLHY